MRILILLLFLSGCGLLTPFTRGPTANVNAPIGKEVTEQVVANQTKDESTKSAERDVIETKELEQITANKVIITNIEENWLLWIVALIGWILPSPSEMTRNAAHFILRLFGRNPHG